MPLLKEEEFEAKRVFRNVN